MSKLKFNPSAKDSERSDRFFMVTAGEMLAEQKAAMAESAERRAEMHEKRTKIDSALAKFDVPEGDSED